MVKNCLNAQNRQQDEEEQAEELDRDVGASPSTAKVSREWHQPEHRKGHQEEALARAPGGRG